MWFVSCKKVINEKNSFVETMADVDKGVLEDQIKKQGEVVRKLKAEKADKEKVRPAMKICN